MPKFDIAGKRNGMIETKSLSRGVVRFGGFD